MEKIITAVVIIFAAALGCSGQTNAQPQKLETLHVHCTTAGTSPMGEGKNCADHGCTSAPDGYVIIRDSYKVAERSNNGGWYKVEFSDPMEVLEETGITAPRRVCMSVGANSDSGMTNIGVRGWMDVTGDGFISSYKKK